MNEYMFGIHIHGDLVRCAVCRWCDHSQKTCHECDDRPVVYTKLVIVWPAKAEKVKKS